MKIKQTVLLFAVLIGFGSFLSGPMVSAAKCAGVDTAIISCDSNVSDNLGTCTDHSYPNNGQCNLGKCSDRSKPQNGACIDPATGKPKAGVTFTPPIPAAGKCVKTADKRKAGGAVLYHKDNTPYCADGETYVAPAVYTKASSVTKTGIWALLIIAINIITFGIGLAAVAGIVWGAIMYTTASGKPEQVKKANMIIANTVLGLIVYAAMYAFMNFIIPGGLIG